VYRNSVQNDVLFLQFRNSNAERDGKTLLRRDKSLPSCAKRMRCSQLRCTEFLYEFFARASSFHRTPGNGKRAYAFKVRDVHGATHAGTSDRRLGLLADISPA
jgi:hypothetical protein